MAKITLHNDRDISTTSVSNQFIDHYMTAANGEYVKIYLYLLRCMSSSECSFSLSAAADKFEHTEKDIQRALRYWEKMNLLRLEYDADKKLSGICFLDSQMKEESAFSDNRKDVQLGMEFSSAASNQRKQTFAPDERQYTAEELLAFQEKDNIRELLFVTEHYLKRPLTPTDINTILFWYEELHFPVELIEYLVEYCLGKGHISLRYMNSVALAWKEAGITTVEQAKRASSAFSKLHFAVMRALGISGRNLISTEIACIDKWAQTYGFTEDIITEACRRTITNTHQPSIEYTDRILENWHRRNVRKLSDIAQADSDYQREKKAAPEIKKTGSSNKFHNFPQRNYDYDELEQQLLSMNNRR